MKSNGIELGLFRHLLEAVAEEMGVLLRKASYSSNIKERRDYSCALYDANGETAAMGDHMPVHLGAMPLSVEHTRKAFRLRPGDVAILNDPFQGGTHLPDITAVSGVFLGGKLQPSFYVANRAHHADVGGMSPGSMALAREIYQEGIRIPPILLVRQGEIDKALLRLLLANVRTPEEREGDLLAQLASLRRGEERLAELSARYGLAAVRRNIASLQNYSERMMRRTLQAIPDGTYRFADYLDGDGFSPHRIRIQVKVTIFGDRAQVDFSGSDAQAPGPVNANLAVTTAALLYVFRCLVAEDVPFTAGTLRPVTLTCPEGTVVNAQAPAAMAAGNVETSQRITDVLLGAMAQAIPERIPAASAGTMSNVLLGGYDRERQRPFAYYETVAGGAGASVQTPGRSAVHTHMTNSWNTPVEALERQFPFRILRYGIRRNSGGPGLHRGGDGIVREYEMLSGVEATLLADRRDQGPWGLRGGRDGAAGAFSLARNGHWSKLPAKTQVSLRKGDVLRVETPGGGGYGSPPPSPPGGP